jgi:hypothetical protein
MRIPLAATQKSKNFIQMQLTLGSLFQRDRKQRVQNWQLLQNGLQTSISSMDSKQRSKASTSALFPHFLALAYLRRPL